MEASAEAAFNISSTTQDFAPQETSDSSCNIPRTKQVFDPWPEEVSSHPFDVALEVEDGKALEAHKCILSTASPFFQKLFNSDMRETSERVVRLEMLTELGLRDILEFIYTGTVQISTEENAQELIEMADYLLLPHLKTVAGRVLLQMLNTSNCISMYYFSERYRCEELITEIKDFIFANFTTVAKTEQFLSLSSKEVKMWISSDEIVVSAEEDVFDVIRKWADCEKSERKKCFAELFREVRLVYVSRDYLHSDIVTNDLVNSNDSCMDLVKEALKFNDCENKHRYTVSPRKSLETPVILVCKEYPAGQKDDILCYYPREDKWSMFQSPIKSKIDMITSCRGKLYYLSKEDKRILLYDPYTICWTSLPLEEQWEFRKLFVRSEEEIYALARHRDSSSLHLPPCIIKKKPESSSWDCVASFDVGVREGMCVVCSDRFIYFIGGIAVRVTPMMTLAAVDRYDLISDTWDKIADIQERRSKAYGAAGHGKIFIAGGYNGTIDLESCEVYHEATNEWHFIASLKKSSSCLSALLCVGSNLYALKSSSVSYRLKKNGVFARYDPDRDEWEETTPLPLIMIRGKWIEILHGAICCSVRVYKECLNFF